MADRVLFISWGEPVHGREQHSLEVFNEAVTYYTELQEGGRIEHFDVVLLQPSGGIDGCMLLHGSHEQIDRIREDQRFRRLMMDAGLVVEHLAQMEGFTGPGITQTMPLYEEAVAKVPQMA